MDGRCQDSVAAYAKRAWGVSAIDTITGAGMDALLNDKTVHSSQPSLEWLKFEAGVSAQGHGSKHAAVVGHTHCAGNPDSNEQYIQEAVRVVRNWNLFESVTGLMVKENANSWEVAEVA